ncbi:hypothetical protein OH77DRAFT_1431184 [Trametes cingulata]|nr:hypothetical protein OH77DRAFT_1490678 [Trametes cingulata]KAI0350316.1 hypothetical protein OH77DRAFT_1431184 [Trametes cingulata]
MCLSSKSMRPPDLFGSRTSSAADLCASAARSTIPRSCPSLHVPSSPMSSIRSLFDLHHDVLDLILGQCSATTLLRLRSTSRTADVHVGDQLETRYRRLLHPYVDDQLGFRAMLDATGSIISGSAALKVCSGLDFTPGDLDVYAPSDTFHAMLSYLINAENFRIVAFGTSASSANPALYEGGIDVVVRLVRQESHIDLIQSLTNSAPLPVMHFWSTCVMSFLTGRGCVIPYPDLLEKRRGLLNPIRAQAPNGLLVVEPLMAKYDLRGIEHRLREIDWARDEDPTARCPRDRSSSCPHTIRWIGDPFCAHVDFRALHQRPRHIAIPFFPMFSPLYGVFPDPWWTLTTVWWRGGLTCGGDCDNGDDAVESAVWTQPFEYLS